MGLRPAGDEMNMGEARRRRFQNGADHSLVRAGVRASLSEERTVDDRRWEGRFANRPYA
ncbi:MAG: hypothetical protein HYY96_16465 [Candidatus Tectomicrobia bacterium]|nr:hypothetical protein [Candidatus Tectomicrobia bacterium]